jgi:predicted SprT family Zn-dependent metalloprotease
MQSAILNNFPITQQEYEELDTKFGKLCHHQSWQLLKKNINNNCSDDREDMLQEIRIALITAGSYYKRQTYIESNFKALEKHIEDPFTKSIFKELKHLWKNRTRHGANRQKFGKFQEIILERLVKKYVPKEKQPVKEQPLNIDSKFITYCKQITWNKQKLLGKKITREKAIRTGLVSLSEFDYLGASCN